VRAFGLEVVMFGAPDQRSQFAVLDHLGRDVHLCNVPLKDLLRVETYRRGLHAEAFGRVSLKPVGHESTAAHS
jgi:phosphosulfolactate synthase